MLGLALFCLFLGGAARAGSPARERVATREATSGRNADTRLWENVYRQAKIDFLTGQLTGKTIESVERYFEKGTNVCYDARECSAGLQACASSSGETTPTLTGFAGLETCATADRQPTDIRLEPSDDPAYAYQVVKGPVRAYFKSSARGDGPNVRLDARTGVAVGTQLLGLFYYDPATQRSALIDTPREPEVVLTSATQGTAAGGGYATTPTAGGGCATIVEGNRLVFRDAFACGSLEYVYTHLGVEQDVVVERPETLPDPASLGFDPATCLLMVGTCVTGEAGGGRLEAGGGDAPDGATTSGPPEGGTTSLPAARVIDTKTGAVLSPDLRAASLADLAARRKEGEALLLEFPSAIGPARRVLTFDAGEAFDAVSLRNGPRALLPGAASPGGSKRDLHKVIERVNEQGDINILEGVSLAWLRTPRRALPVRIDYTFIVKDGAKSPKHETWIKGVTYRVTSVYEITTGTSLVIEPGAIVKEDGTLTTESYNFGIRCKPGGTLICRGTSYDPIVFAQADNDTIGADTYSTVTTVFPLSYLQVQSKIPSIEYCRFQGGLASVIIEGRALDARTTAEGPHVQHCVFHGKLRTAFYPAQGYPAWDSTIACLHFEDKPPSSTQAQGDWEFSVFDCLFANYLIAGVSGYSQTLGGFVEVCNSTFDGTEQDVDLYDGSWSGIRILWLDAATTADHNLHITNNVIMNVKYGVNWVSTGTLATIFAGQSGACEHNRFGGQTIPYYFRYETDGGWIGVPSGVYCDNDNVTISPGMDFLTIGGCHLDSDGAPTGQPYYANYWNGRDYLADYQAVTTSSANTLKFQIGGSSGGGIIDKGNSYANYAKYKTASGYYDGLSTRSNVGPGALDDLRSRTVIRPLRIGDADNGADFNIDSAQSEAADIQTSVIVANYLDTEPSSGDLGTDLGYHYPAVHAVLRDQVNCTTDLAIHPGTVLASLAPEATLRPTSESGPDRTLRIIGTPDAYVRFTDYAAAGDCTTQTQNFFSELSASCAAAYVAIPVDEMAPGGALVKYAIFEHAVNGLSVCGVPGQDYFGGEARPQISDSIFRYNGLWSVEGENGRAGVLISHADADVMNCLFDMNRHGVAVQTYASPGMQTRYQPNIIGCTFNGGMRGVWVWPGFYAPIYPYNDTSVADHTYAVVEDNLFANIYGTADTTNAGAISVYQYSGTTSAAEHVTAIVRRNLFWNNRTHLSSPELTLSDYNVEPYGTETNFPDSEDAVATSPMFVNLSSQEGSWREDDAASGKFYLAQNTGDASREPLVTGRIVNVEGENIASTECARVYVYGARGWVGGPDYGIPTPEVPNTASTADRKFASEGGSGATGEMTTLSYTLVAMGQYNGGGYPGQTTGEERITITFLTRPTNDSGCAQSKVRLRLPGGKTIGDGQYLTFWVAQDGSLYWARLDKACAATIQPEMDVFTALHHDAEEGGSDMLASTAYDSSTTSPAVDRGTREFLSGGWTSTDGLPAADHILPIDYLTGYAKRANYGYKDGQGEPYDADATQTQQLARVVDIGYHYGGQAQNYAPASAASATTGVVSVAPAIALTPKMDRFQGNGFNYGGGWGWGKWDDPTSGPTSPPDLALACYATTGVLFATRTTAFTYHDYWTSQTHEGLWPAPPVSNLQAWRLGEGGGQWIDVLGDQMVTSASSRRWGEREKYPGYWESGVYATVYPTWIGHISSIDALAIPADKPTTTGEIFVGAYVSWYKHTDNKDEHVWELQPFIGIDVCDYTNDRWNTLSLPVDPFEGANFDGGIALSNDGNGAVHFFWTQPTATAPTHAIWHAQFNPDPNYNQGRPITDLSAVDQAFPINPDDGSPPEVINPVKIMSATFDDDVGQVRMVWPEYASEGAKLWAARYQAGNNWMESRNELLPSSTAMSSRTFNSIAFADFDSSGTAPAWLKSKDLKMESFVFSNRDTWRCTVTSGVDSWDDKRALAEFSAATSNTQSVVAARGLRLPRYVGRAEGIKQDSVFTDGLLTLARGYHPVAKQDAGTFVDEWLAARAFTVEDSDLNTTLVVISVTPLRP
jgi:hypothetical protein